MTIILNGQVHHLTEPYDLSSLLESLGLSNKPIIIEYNLEPLSKENWATTQLNQGDKLEIITLAAGG